MASEIQVAGFTLTADEWAHLDAATQAELMPAADAFDLDDEALAFEDGTDVVW